MPLNFVCVDIGHVAAFLRGSLAGRIMSILASADESKSIRQIMRESSQLLGNLSISYMYKVRKWCSVVREFPFLLFVAQPLRSVLETIKAYRSAAQAVVQLETSNV